MSGQEPNPIVTEAIDGLCAGRDLESPRAREILLEMMSGRVNASQTAAFLIALRAKGETAEELAGLAMAMREMVTSVRPASPLLVDTAGTGGGPRTFNVSTTAALIAAGAGCRVAKHGNRSATSPSGSADLLEALGVRIELSPDDVALSVDEIGFGFMFAPAHHPATRHVVPVRKDLGTRTAFNLLGPLTNPAGAKRQVIGVSDPAALDRIARAAAQLGVERAFIVHGEDGLDEVSIAAPTTVLEVRDGSVSSNVLAPEDVGFSRHALEAVTGGSPEENALMTRAILSGEPGARRDFAVLNAAPAICAAGMAESFAEGAEVAEAAIDSGAASAVLDRLVEFTRERAQ